MRQGRLIPFPSEFVPSRCNLCGLAGPSASASPWRVSARHAEASSMGLAPVDVTKGISVSINRRDKVACVRGRRIL